MTLFPGFAGMGKPNRSAGMWQVGLVATSKVPSVIRLFPSFRHPVPQAAARGWDGFRAP
jgi:hypothetical protein